MIIERVIAGPLHTNAYVVGFHGKGVIIDPGYESREPLLALVHQHQLTIEAIWLTHSHFDHIAELYAFKTMEGWPIYVHERDAENVRQPGSDGIPNFLNVRGVEPDGYFSDRASFGELTCEVIPTPGHSPGGVCFYFAEQKVLFSGDTLFKGTYGRVDQPHASAADMKASLRRLGQLPDDVIVYPGHGGVTTMGEEKRHRWFT